MRFQDDGAGSTRQCGLQIAAQIAAPGGRSLWQTAGVGSCFRCCFVVCVAGAFVVVVGGCDDGGRAAHRSDALDVAGAWVDDAAATVVTIENEADKNDVVVFVVRDAVPAVEAEFLDGENLDARALTLGAGIDPVRDEAVGGENVSFDGGASTVVDCDGDDIDVDDGVVRYSTRLTGDSTGLSGVLRLSLRRRVPRAGDVDGARTESTQVETPLVLVPVVDR